MPNDSIDWAEFGGKPLDQPGASPEADIFSEFGGRPAQPGESPNMPIEETAPDLGFIERWKIKTFAEPFGPDTVRSYLDKGGFESAQIPDGRFSIRKRGTAPWY